ncbi:MAG: SDR family oxidoreductase [Bacteroidota bacterium]
MNIVLTGASRGMGFHVLKQFLEGASHQVVALSKDIDRFDNFDEALRQHPRLRFAEFDVVSYPEEQLAALTDHMEQVDILLNNAGMLVNKDFEQISLEEWRAILDVNLIGPVRLIRSLLPKLRRSPSPHIVNIGSMGGFPGSIKFRGLSSYSVSKAALANLTECLAVELDQPRIAANCLCLGAVDTEMFREAFPQYTAPLQSHEMASFIHDFALTGHRFFNGKVLPVSTTTP